MRRMHTYTPATLDVTRILGLEIARARRAQRWSQAELAERAGISVNTLRSVERGAPTVAIGIVFELSTLLGLNLLGARSDDLPALLARGQDKLALLPSRVRSRAADEVQDDF